MERFVHRNFTTISFVTDHMSFSIWRQSAVLKEKQATVVSTRGFYVRGKHVIVVEVEIPQEKVNNLKKTK